MAWSSSRAVWGSSMISAARMSHIKPGSLFAQPFLPLSIRGHHLVDFVPEGIGVIGLMEVTQLVDDDVVDDRLRCHHAFPMER